MIILINHIKVLIILFQFNPRDLIINSPLIFFIILNIYPQYYLL